MRPPLIQFGVPLSKNNNKNIISHSLGARCKSAPRHNPDGIPSKLDE
jgi:hypothetical protein